LRFCADGSTKVELMRRVLGAAVLLACVSCGGGSTSQSSPAAPSGDLGDTLRVAGQVHDFSTGAGVAGVTGAFGNASGVTNESGRAMGLPSL
jgi:hypothetical protein